MKRVELKRIVEFLWKSSPADEKIPFAGQGALPDNGSFSKNYEADDNKKAAKEFPEDEGANLEGPMSIPRKLCFAMSFNLWILYFLVLGWLLPCNNYECGLPDPMERNLSTIRPWTNLEPMNGKGLPSLAIVGYEDGLELKLAALATFDATFEWNISLPFFPKKIQCNFENTFDANEDGIPDCLLSGYNDVYAFNASDGHVFWHQSLPSDEGNITSGFHPTGVHSNETYLIGTYADKVVVLSSRTGKRTMETDLPCYSPFEIKIATIPVVNSSFTMWNILCNYGDQVEAWGFGERDVLSDGNLENKADAPEFALLFSESKSGGSIDLGCDVIFVPDGPLLLSWSDRVVMVTPEATAWERRFPDPLTVACIAVGNFSQEGSQVAAAVNNGTDTTVFLLSLKNGTITNSVTLTDRKAQSLEKVPGVTDLLLLKSLFLGNPPPRVSNFSDPIPTEETNFAVIDFHSRSTEIKDIVIEYGVLGSTLNRQTNGEIDLLVLKTDNGNATYQKFVIQESDSQNSLCGHLS